MCGELVSASGTLGFIKPVPAPTGEAPKGYDNVAIPRLLPLENSNLFPLLPPTSPVSKESKPETASGKWALSPPCSCSCCTPDAPGGMGKSLPLWFPSCLLLGQALLGRDFQPLGGSVLTFLLLVGGCHLPAMPFCGLDGWVSPANTSLCLHPSHDGRGWLPHIVLSHSCCFFKSSPEDIFTLLL